MGGDLSKGGVVVISCVFLATLLYFLKYRRTKSNGNSTLVVKDKGRVEYDYVIVGGGPSGLYLATLLAEKFPNRSICVVNKDGSPFWFPWKVYMLSLVGVVFPSLVPSFSYSDSLKSHKKQFVNCSYLGGCSNINAAVGPVPKEEDIEKSFGVKFVQRFKEFCSGPELHRVSRPVPTEPGLERFSKDLNKLGIFGSSIRAFTDGWRRIHPMDMVPPSVNIKVATAKKIIIQGSQENGPATARGVLCEATRGNVKTVESVYAKKKTILCCGAIESPILLIKSGCGPSEILHQLNFDLESIKVKNDNIGTNLQDHWVKRAEANVPEKYRYPLLYPRILGYKHQFKDIAVGFGKLQIAGRNLVSVASATCKNPGKIVLHEGKLEPFLKIGPDDISTYEENFRELQALLLKIDVKLAEKKKPFAPNWHLSCTLSIDTCVSESLQIIGIEKLYCADVSVLKTIIPMNTQIVSYFIPYYFACSET